MKNLFSDYINLKGSGNQNNEMTSTFPIPKFQIKNGIKKKKKKKNTNK